MHSKRESRVADGFALPDLLVVVAVCAVLAVLPLHALSSGSSGARTAGCLAGLKRLQYAWECYAADNQGRLATATVDTTTEAWVNDSFESSSGQPPPYLLASTYRDSKRAKFAPYLPDPQVYHCPADESRVRYGGKFIGRIRSRSMNGAFGTGGGWLAGGYDPGQKRYRTYWRLSDLVNPPPASLFVLIDEHPDSINDGSFANMMVEQPANTRIIDYPASYHDGGAGLSFADGHAEIHHWVDRRTKPVVKSQLALNVSSPNNQDIAWLAARTSARIQ